MSSRHVLFNLSFSAEERALLEAAARRSCRDVVDFVRRAALQAAETEVGGEPQKAIAAEEKDRFEAWVTAPATSSPALARLAANRSEHED